MMTLFSHWLRGPISKALAFAAVVLVAVAANADDGRSYDIEQFYVKEKLQRGSKVLLSMDRLEDRAEAVLIPTDPKEGEYSVEVQKIDFNFYWIVGTDLYVETKFCYEMAYPRKKALLIVSSPYRISKGELVFP